MEVLCRVFDVDTEVFKLVHLMDDATGWKYSFTIHTLGVDIFEVELNEYYRCEVWQGQGMSKVLSATLVEVQK